MKNKYKFWLRLFPVLALAVLVSCFGTAPSQSSSIGGSGSEVVGVVKYPDSSTSNEKSLARGLSGLPLSGCNVFIHPTTFLADYGVDDIPVTKTENDGFFRISKIRPGKHFVYIKDSAGNGVLRQITISDDSITINLGHLLAEKTAGAQIQYNGTASGDVFFYVSVRGTGLTVLCTDRGVFARLTEICVDPDVDYMFTIRMEKPFNTGYDIDKIRLQPGKIITLNDITDNLLK